MPGKNEVQFIISAKNLTRKELKVLQSDIKATGAEIKKLNTEANKIGAAGKKMKSAGQIMALGAGIASGAIGLLVNNFSNFENGIGRVAALTNRDLIPTMEKYGSTIERIAVETATPVEQLNNSLFDIISAGVDEAEALKVLESSAKGAKGAFSDLESVVGGNLALMNSYNLTGKDVFKIMDQVNLAADKGITTFGAIGNNIGRVAAVASGFNITMGDLLASVAAITTTKVSTEEAITRVQALITSISKPTEDAIAALDQLQKRVPAADRISLSVKSLQSKGLVEYFKTIQNLTKGDATALNELFGANVRAASAINILTQTQDTFLNTAKEMNSVGENGELTLKKFGIAAQTSAFKIEQAKQEIAAAARALGRDLLPAALKLGKILTSIARGLVSFINEHRTAAKVLSGIAVAITAITLGGGGLLIFVGQLTIAIGALNVAVGGLTVAALANPFVAAAAVVVGLVASVKTLNKEIEKSSKRELESRLVKGKKETAVEDLPAFDINQIEVDSEKKAKAKVAADRAALEKELSKPVPALYDKSTLTGFATTAAASTGGIQNRLISDNTSVMEKETKEFKDQLDKRLTDYKKFAAGIDAENKKLSGDKENVDLFAPGMQFITDAVSNVLSAAGGKGFIGKNISGGTTDNSKKISIDRVVLPDVQDPDAFLDRLYRKTDSLAFTG